MATARAARRAQKKLTPKTPTLEKSLVWAALANVAEKQAKKTEVGLQLGEYKVHVSLQAKIFLGPRRKPRSVAAVVSADLDVDPPQPYSAAPREKVLLAGLLAAVGQRAAAAIIAALPAIPFDELTRDQLDDAKRLLDSIKRQQPGAKKRIRVDAQVDHAI